MVREVFLPKLGQTMEEGAIIEWLKKEGDPVERGDLLFTFESDKATLEVEAAARGFFQRAARIISVMLRSESTRSYSAIFSPGTQRSSSCS